MAGPMASKEDPQRTRKAVVPERNVQPQRVIIKSLRVTSRVQKGRFHPQTAVHMLAFL